MSWDMAGLPSESVRLRRLAEEMREAAEAVDRVVRASGAVDEWPECGTVSPAATILDPDEPAIVLRWLAQAANRIEVARVPTHG